MEHDVPRVQRIRLEPKARAVQVVAVQDVSAHFKRVTFAGPALADFTSPSFDDHVKFILEGQAGEDRVARNYTPRAYSNADGTIDIEFALHGDGAAASWAAQAAPGQQVTIAGPRGAMVIPMDYDWHLLVGDDTALPAIARRLEELPAGARVIVLAQVDDPADRRALPGAADIHWLDAGGDLAEAVRALALPSGAGFAWGAGEAAAMARLRTVLVEDKGLPKHRVRVSAYWKRGESAHHENLENAQAG